MASIFTECRRTLKADGVMTLIFTHKATGAWDALTTGLMDAGFAMTASRPVNTEGIVNQSTHNGLGSLRRPLRPAPVSLAIFRVRCR